MLTQYAMPRFLCIQRVFLSSVLLWVLGAGSVWAEPVAMDFLVPSGGSTMRDAAGQQKAWKFAEYSGIRLHERESVAGLNDHPARIDAAVLERVLKAVELIKANDRVAPLFDAAEARSLSVSLSHALAKASAQEDVLLFSSARRESGMLALPATVVARLFMTQGQLNLIVNDARADLVAKIRSTRLMPDLNFGGRTVPSSVQLKVSQGQLLRADWVVLPLAEHVLPVSDQKAAVPAISEGSGAVRDALYYKLQAVRLEGLRQLREQSLISEDEYRQKRKVIVDGL